MVETGMAARSREQIIVANLAVWLFMVFLLGNNHQVDRMGCKSLISHPYNPALKYLLSQQACPN
jgi:hypothetical protein